MAVFSQHTISRWEKSCVKDCVCFINAWQPSRLLHTTRTDRSKAKALSPYLYSPYAYAVFRPLAFSWRHTLEYQLTQWIITSHHITKCFVLIFYFTSKNCFNKKKNPSRCKYFLSNFIREKFMMWPIFMYSHIRLCMKVKKLFFNFLWIIMSI